MGETDPSPLNAELADHLEKLGRRRVEELLSADGFAQALVPGVHRWLDEKDQESARVRGALDATQTEIATRAAAAAERASAAAERQAVAAERAALAAERANKRATIALIIAIISLISTAIITVIGIWIVHRDSARLPPAATSQLVAGPRR
jgi:hypothetical protein